MIETMSAPRRAKGVQKFMRPLIMGVVNCTPDSFHEGSRAQTVSAAVEAALKLSEEGAEIIDIGGQSTRPGSEPVPADIERERVIPVIKALAKRANKFKISIDTDKAVVAEEALSEGAVILNDITALRGDKDMAKAALKADQVILMHMLGDSPKNMQADPKYKDAFLNVFNFLQERKDAYLAAGGRESQLYVDPGIGFGKTLEHNLTLIRRAGEFASIAPVVLGVSRKSMFSKISPDGGSQDRLAGSLAVAAHACFNGVSVLRVHDVFDTRRALDALQAVSRSS